MMGVEVWGRMMIVVFVIDVNRSFVDRLERWLWVNVVTVMTVRPFKFMRVLAIRLVGVWRVVVFVYVVVFVLVEHNVFLVVQQILELMNQVIVRRHMQVNERLDLLVTVIVFGDLD